MTITEIVRDKRCVRDAKIICCGVTFVLDGNHIQGMPVSFAARDDWQFVEAKPKSRREEILELCDVIDGHTCFKAGITDRIASLIRLELAESAGPMFKVGDKVIAKHIGGVCRITTQARYRVDSLDGAVHSFCDESELRKAD